MQHWSRASRWDLDLAAIPEPDILLPCHHISVRKLHGCSAVHGSCLADGSVISMIKGLCPTVMFAGFIHVQAIPMLQMDNDLQYALQDVMGLCLP